MEASLRSLFAWAPLWKKHVSTVSYSVAVNAQWKCWIKPRASKTPRGFCHKQVQRNQQALCCDSYDLWYHMKCICMPLEVYNSLNKSYTSWIFSQCCSPDFSSSLNSSNTDFQCSKSFSGFPPSSPVSSTLENNSPRNLLPPTKHSTP